MTDPNVKTVVILTDEQMEKLATAAAEKALAKVYTEVGKSVLTKFLWLLGSLVLGWAAATGRINIKQ